MNFIYLAYIPSRFGNKTVQYPEFYNAFSSIAWLKGISTVANYSECVRSKCDVRRVSADIDRVVFLWVDTRALKSHALSVGVMHTNVILRSLAEIIISSAFNVFDLNSSFWGGKLLLKYRLPTLYNGNSRAALHQSMCSLTFAHAHMLIIDQKCGLSWY